MEEEGSIIAGYEEEAVCSLGAHQVTGLAWGALGLIAISALVHAARALRGCGCGGGASSSAALRCAASVAALVLAVPLAAGDGVPIGLDAYNAAAEWFAAWASSSSPLQFRVPLLTIECLGCDALWWRVLAVACGAAVSAALPAGWPLAAYSSALGGLLAVANVAATAGGSNSGGLLYLLALVPILAESSIRAAARAGMWLVRLASVARRRPSSSSSSSSSSSGPPPPRKQTQWRLVVIGGMRGEPPGTRALDPATGCVFSTAVAAAMPCTRAAFRATGVAFDGGTDPYFEVFAEDEGGGGERQRVALFEPADGGWVSPPPPGTTSDGGAAREGYRRWVSLRVLAATAAGKRALARLRFVPNGGLALADAKAAEEAAAAAAAGGGGAVEVVEGFALLDLAPGGAYASALAAWPLMWGRCAAGAADRCPAATGACLQFLRKERFDLNSMPYTKQHS